LTVTVDYNNSEVYSLQADIKESDGIEN